MSNSMKLATNIKHSIISNLQNWKEDGIDIQEATLQDNGNNIHSKTQQPIKLFNIKLSYKSENKHNQLTPEQFSWTTAESSNLWQPYSSWGRGSVNDGIKIS